MRAANIAVGVALGAVAGAAVVHLRHRDPWPRFVTAAREASERSVGRLAFDIRVPVYRSAVAPSRHITELVADILESESDEHRRAIVELFVGRPAEAKDRLETMARSRATPAIWNDLAVALSAQPTNGAPQETLIAALAAADRSIELDPSQTAPRFNRALIIERLGLVPLAAEAFDDYLRIDSGTEWAVEARDRVRELRSHLPAASQWQDRVPALLAAARDKAHGPIRDATRSFPEDARSYSENLYLPEWGQAIAKGDSDGAAARLTLVRIIAETLHRSSGESLLRDAIASIDSADGARLRLSAAACVAFGEAALLYKRREIAPAAVKFAEAGALFERARSPMTLLTRYFLASAKIDAGDRAQAMIEIDKLAADTPPNYYALHAMLHRLRGVMLYFEGSFGQSLAEMLASRDAYQSIGEIQNAVDMSGRIAATLCDLGRAREAWPIHIESLAAAGAVGRPGLLQSALHSAAFTALREQRWDLASSLLKLEVAVHDPSPRRYAEALNWLAFSALRAQMPSTARRALDAARASATAIADPGFREGAENDLRLFEAFLVAGESPDRAAMLLTQYLDIAERRGRISRVPEILVVRAGMHRRAGRDVDAENDLRAAIAMIEERRRRVDRDLFRDTFLGKSSAAFTVLSDLLDSRGDVDGAIEVGDLHRARILIERQGTDPLSLRQTMAAMLPRTAIVVYGVFGERLVIYAIRHDGIHRFEQRVSTELLERTIDAFVEAIQGEDMPAVQQRGRWLFNALLAPAQHALAGADRWILVGDAPLNRLPFCALIQPVGRFLAQDVAITIAPGLRAYGSSATRSRSSAFRAMVAIGNPLIDDALYPGLEPLPAAETEAKAVAAMYDNSTVLLRNDATEARSIAAMEAADAIHIATHALADTVDSDRTRLLLTGGDSLTTVEIANLDLTGVDVVVLGGCRTAAAGRSHGYVQSLGSAFLAAGAKHAVGALWDIEDSAAREFSLTLHRSLRGGIRPDEAVRRAQADMIGRTSIAAWSAMQLYSTGGRAQ